MIALSRTAPKTQELPLVPRLKEHDDLDRSESSHLHVLFKSKDVKYDLDRTRHGQRRRRQGWTLEANGDLRGRGADSAVSEEHHPTRSLSRRWRRNLKCGIHESSRISMEGDYSVAVESPDAQVEHNVAYVR